LFAVLFGLTLATLQEKGLKLHQFIDTLAKILFIIVSILMKLAPFGAFGAMAFTVGKYGLTSLMPLIQLMACFYLSCLLFIFIVLGLISRIVGFSIFKFVVYLRDELFVVLGTSSSESVFAQIMSKMEQLGCSKSVVNLVIPTGYSFNLDGSCIYLSMAVIFVAQATNTTITPMQEFTLFAVLLLTSKGATGVVGSAFVVLIATLSTLPTIPVEGLALILGIDRFMSEARALTNLIGNGVATVVAAYWENELDTVQLQRTLNRSSNKTALRSPE
jgi:aerobic C4-dicarboxylate transport protein